MTERTFVTGFTEEVEEHDILVSELRHTNLMPPGSGRTKMPPRVHVATPDPATESTPAATVAKPAHLTDQLTDPQKAVVGAVRALGWDVCCYRTELLLAPRLYATASGEHSVGDEKFPAETQVLTTVEARAGKHLLGFTAQWLTRKGTAFTEARITDPVGFPVENFYDYKLPALEAKRLGLTQDQAETKAEWLGYQYNDGSYRTEHHKLVTTAGELTAWIDDYLELLAPAHKKLTPKKKVKPTRATDAEVLENGEWNE